MGHFKPISILVAMTAGFTLAVEVETDAFSCTFPASWLNLGVFGSSVSDSSVSLIKTGDGSSYAFASLSLFPNENADPTDTALPEGVLTDSLSYVIQKRDTKTLGKYSFQSFEYEWTTAGSDSTPPGKYNGAMWQTHVSGHTFMTVLSSSRPAVTWRPR